MRELEESPPADRAACVNGTAHCRAVDAEVHAERDLLFQRSFVELRPLFEREVEEPVLPKRRASFLAVDATLADIGKFVSLDRDRHPVPSISHPSRALGNTEEAVPCYSSILCGL